MKNLDNPFIIKFYEAFDFDNHYYIATDYADEGSLESFLNK